MCTKERAVRNELRRFRVDYPSRYDYALAAIPEALSEEQEQERRAKEAERRKAMKKVKAAKLKVSAGRARSSVD